MKYENTFKAIDQILWKEQGCGSELDYLEQKSWMLFLKYLDDLETEREDKHEMTVLYESNIQRMGNAGRNGGEYYTPRPLIPHECDALKQAILRQVFE